METTTKTHRRGNNLKNVSSGTRGCGTNPTLLITIGIPNMKQMAVLKDPHRKPTDLFPSRLRICASACTASKQVQKLVSSARFNDEYPVPTLSAKWRITPSLLLMDASTESNCERNTSCLSVVHATDLFKLDENSSNATIFEALAARDSFFKPGTLAAASVNNCPFDSHSLILG